MNDNIVLTIANNAISKYFSGVYELESIFIKGEITEHIDPKLVTSNGIYYTIMLSFKLLIGNEHVKPGHIIKFKISNFSYSNFPNGHAAETELYEQICETLEYGLFNFNLPCRAVTTV